MLRERNTKLSRSEVGQQLNSLLKNSEKQIPRRLKSARDDKNKGLATAQLKLRPFKAGA
jgi:hypothetical protein